MRGRICSLSVPCRRPAHADLRPRVDGAAVPVGAATEGALMTLFTATATPKIHPFLCVWVQRIALEIGAACYPNTVKAQSCGRP